MKSKIWYGIVLVLMMALTVGICYLVFTDKVNFKKIQLGVKESKRELINKEYENKYDKIIIESDASNIEVINTLEDTINVIVYNEKNKTKVLEEENILKIKNDSKPCKKICIGFKITKIIVEIPEDYDKEIVINNAFGNINVENVKDLKIIEDFGDIKINEVNNLELTNAFGDSKIDKVTNYINLHNNFGDIKIEELDLKKDSNIVTDFGDIRINKVNEVEITARTSFGDVSNSTNNDHESEIKLKVNTDFGDIKIK